MCFCILRRMTWKIRNVNAPENREQKTKKRRKSTDWTWVQSTMSLIQQPKCHIRSYENEKRWIVVCGVWNNNNRHLILSADVRAPSSKCKSNFKSLPLVGCSRRFCIIIIFDVPAAVAALQLSGCFKNCCALRPVSEFVRRHAFIIMILGIIIKVETRVWRVWKWSDSRRQHTHTFCALQQRGRHACIGCLQTDDRHYCIEREKRIRTKKKNVPERKSSILLFWKRLVFYTSNFYFFLSLFHPPLTHGTWCFSVWRFTASWSSCK